jgi:hypothetical protein
MFSRDSSSTTCSLPYLSVLSRLLYWNPQLDSWSYLSHRVPMGYSYWCSHLNLTIHIAKSNFHFTYSVSPRLIRTLDIPLVYSSSYEAAEPFNIDSTLSYFRSLFNDDTPPIIILLTTEVTSWIIQYFQRTFVVVERTNFYQAARLYLHRTEYFTTPLTHIVKVIFITFNLFNKN